MSKTRHKRRTLKEMFAEFERRRKERERAKKREKWWHANRPPGY